MKNRFNSFNAVDKQLDSLDKTRESLLINFYVLQLFSQT